MFIELPPQFTGLKVHWVQQVNENEYSSSCPNCGIDTNKHSDANPSNRFVMWLESRNTGRPFGWCRKCGYKWTPEKSDAIWTEEEKQEFKRKRIELIERENERVEAFARDVVMAQGFYRQYMENLQSSQYAKDYLAKRGFDDMAWIKYFGFGFIPDFLCQSRIHGNYHSPAISIPVRGQADLTENVKVRLTNEKHPLDRFRNLYKSKAQHIYYPLKKEERSVSKAIIIEGEMKACQVAQSFKIPLDTELMASQGNGIGERMVYAVRNCDVVYLSLDPDSFVPNEKGISNAIVNAKKIGYDRVRFIMCRQKIDDAILQGFNFINAYNMAVKPQSLGLKLI